MSDNRVNISVSGGSIFAVILSWALNHSIGWAILHFLFGWFYIIYALLVRSVEILPALRRMFGA